jgi:hypothetical protein
LNELQKRFKNPISIESYPPPIVIMRPSEAIKSSAACLTQDGPSADEVALMPTQGYLISLGTRVKTNVSPVPK